MLNFDYFQFIEVGVVTSVESNHKPVETARKGMEVCVKIEPVPGEAPKMFGRHFDETDMLVSKVGTNFCVVVVGCDFLIPFNKSSSELFYVDK